MVFLIFSAGDLLFLIHVSIVFALRVVFLLLPVLLITSSLPLTQRFWSLLCLLLLAVCLVGHHPGGSGSRVLC